MSASRSPDTATPVGRTMHAIVHRQYGTPDRLTFEEVARPLPGDEEETLGANVSTFRPGDEVFGDAVKGAFAEYVVVPARLIALKPCGALGRVTRRGRRSFRSPTRAVTDLQGGLRVAVNVPPMWPQQPKSPSMNPGASVATTKVSPM